MRREQSGPIDRKTYTFLLCQLYVFTTIENCFLEKKKFDMFKYTRKGFQFYKIHETIYKIVSKFQNGFRGF